MAMAKGGGAGSTSVGGLGLGGSGFSNTIIQKQRNLQQRADSNITSLIDNFSNMVAAARINEPVTNAQEAFQISVHSAKVVLAGDALLKLISELKQTAVFSDFGSLNEHVAENRVRFESQVHETESILAKIAEEAAEALHELEAHYYGSRFRSSS
eukprot:TRINITY_DN19920_c0_g2_i1.p1 TRINITY_DN19920_c0_g2~~TRINITY_DN19920_c0_g2_i1.p1  ORF type:complete len:155 (-),score=44.44 TRINITY_DN19920_c0_g2_i1:75-539(-)